MSDIKDEVKKALIEVAYSLGRSEEEVRGAEEAGHIRRAFKYAGATAEELVVLAKQKHNFDRGGEYHHFHEHVLDMLRGKLILVDPDHYKALQKKSDYLRRLETESYLSVPESRRDLTIEEVFSYDRGFACSRGALTRLRHSLASESIFTIRQLVAKTHDELLKFPYLGRKSVNIITEELAVRGLHLGMDLEGVEK